MKSDTCKYAPETEKWKKKKTAIYSGDLVTRIGDGD